MTQCERVLDCIPDLLRNPNFQLAEDCVAHLPSCEDCRLAVEMAPGLSFLFAPTPEEELPEDLVQRTLDRCLVLLPAEDSEPQISPAVEDPIDAEGGFRSSVAFLTASPLSNPTTPLTRARLFLRIVTQTAAAVLISVSLLVAWDVLHPAYTYARESQSTRRCQQRLKGLWEQAMKYKKGVKDIEDLKNSDPDFLMGEKLRAKLVDRGYVDQTDFRCPSIPSASLGQAHFTGVLFPTAAKFDYPVFWEKRVGTHVEGSDEMNVVFSNGEIRSMGSDQFFEALTRAFSNWRLLKLKKRRKK
jgi:hypothetical protein